MALTLVPTFDRLAERPVGRALLGRSFLAWCATPRLVGTVHFGTRGPDDAATLTRLYELAHHPALRPPLRRVVDGRDFAGIEDGAWSAMADALAGRVQALDGLFERQAVVVGPGVDGAVRAALLPALGPGDRFRAFTDVDAAYRWADPDAGPGAAAAVAALLASSAAAAQLEARVCAWVRAHLRDARVEPCARALGLSTRGLQRALGAAGTPFRSLVARERVEAARRLLARSDAKVEAVAHAVGCSSASQLGALLRRAGLPPPARLRAR